MDTMIAYEMIKKT